MLRVLHVSCNDGRDGAGKAAYRWHAALKQAGVVSRMLVRKKSSAESDILSLSDYQNPYWIKGRAWLASRAFGDDLSVNLFATGTDRVINSIEADVVHLHWINAEMISIEEIAKIRKPIIWTLHDMWPLCGAEHVAHNALYFDHVNKDYRKHYWPKPQRLSLNGIVNQWTFRRKLKFWRALDLRLIAPSTWMGGLVRQSKILKQYPLTVIPNVLDATVFAPIEKKRAREAWGIPPEKKVVLFGASDPHCKLKGGDLFWAAMRRLSDEAMEIIVFGANGFSAIADLPVRCVGRIDEERRLASLYAAADVFVCPSRIDNYPNTVLEALACGTPCVGYRTGGLSDLIVPGENGWLAEPCDVTSLASSIHHALKPPLLRFTPKENTHPINTLIDVYRDAAGGHIV